MKSARAFEYGVGILSLLIVLFFIFDFSKRYLSAHQTNVETKTYFATFGDVDGINVGSDVKIAGLTVGHVKAIEIGRDYRVRLEFDISSKYSVPGDSSIIVATSGILGGKYLKLRPGSEQVFLPNGGEVPDTQNSIGIEGLLSLFKK